MWRVLRQEGAAGARLREIVQFILQGTAGALLGRDVREAPHPVAREACHFIASNLLQIQTSKALSILRQSLSVFWQEEQGLPGHRVSAAGLPTRMEQCTGFV